MKTSGFFERAARDDRPIVALLLAAAAGIGLWATLASGSALMDPARASFGIGATILLFAMWSSMMLAMMLPSAVPAILIFHALNRKIAGPARTTPTLVLFISGYLAIWTLFSLLAVALHLLTRNLIAMTAMMAVTSGILGAGLLTAAGLYQFSPLKNACLRRCQSPFFYFARNWRKGAVGAFRMGLAHGLYCLGCCWVLMGLLFYGGVMQPFWIIGLAAYVGAEKLAPAKFHVHRWSGLILIGWGAATVAVAL